MLRGLKASLFAAFAALAIVPVAGEDLGTVLSKNDKLSTYYKLIKKYPEILLQLPSYAGVTIVAPSDSAFKKATYFKDDNQTQVTNILEYHILQGTLATAAVPEGPGAFAPTLLTDEAYTNVTEGQNVIVNKQPGNVVVFTTGEGSRSTLLDGDIRFSGGLVQIVDTLLVPPSRFEPTARDAYRDLTSFLGAVYKAGLVEEFSETKNVTIFAPRNSAFQQLAGTLDDLDRDSLRQMLRYHLVPGRVLPSSDIKNGTVLDTAASDPAGDKLPLFVRTAGNNAYLDSSQIIQTDILVANGVVHMVDNLLNPNATSSKPQPKLPKQPPAYPVTGTQTETGADAPTPYISALPCTTDCPVTTSATSTATSTTALPSTTDDGYNYEDDEGHAPGRPLYDNLVAAGALAGAVGMQFVGLW